MPLGLFGNRGQGLSRKTSIALSFPPGFSMAVQFLQNQPILGIDLRQNRDPIRSLFINFFESSTCRPLVIASTRAEMSDTGKALIIAEKPSVAADIAKALGGFSKHDDYFENDHFVVSSAVACARIDT